jgi:hypothetical protein
MDDETRRNLNRAARLNETRRPVWPWVLTIVLMVAACGLGLLATSIVIGGGR